MLFFDFCLFHFSKFQITIVKNYLEKLSTFIMAFESSNKVLLHGKCFWSTNFWQWNDGPFNFEICMEKRFIISFIIIFLNDRNIVTSLSTIHFKCWSIPKTVWHFQKKKTFLQSNFLKICLEQFKLSGHVELEKWNMFAFSNLQFEQKRWLKLKNYTFFQFGWKSGYKIYYFS